MIYIYIHIYIYICYQGFRSEASPARLVHNGTTQRPSGDHFWQRNPLKATEPPFYAFRFCVENFHHWIVNKIKANLPEELCQLCGLESGKFPKLPLAVQNQTASEHERHA